uniref:Uncharacterized protein n=1 Tax=Acrobeloides nanus TaxID=290746 RepID=A0A914DQ99_9BILA
MKRHFNRCSEFSWYLIDDSDRLPLKERCSHSSCYYEPEQAMYLFGGCTAAHAAFNDLCKLNLANREWERVIPSSTLPSSRALASFVVYKNNLILYGGFSKSSMNPIHQTTTFFGDVYFYNIDVMKWEQFFTDNAGPLLAGHSVSIVGDYMLVFGGSTGNSCNNTVFILDLKRRTWIVPTINGTSPSPRYGQSLIKLDENNFVVIGGCAGPGMVLNDVCLLTMDFTNFTGQWTLLKIENPELTPTNIWCHSACKVGQNAVLFGKPIHQGLIRRHRSRSTNSSPKRRISSPDSPQDRQAVAAFVNSRLQNCKAESSSELDGESENSTLKRKPFLSSKSLDEQEPKSSIPISQSKPSLLTSTRGSELHRTCSIPAIIVGEIPKLIVTSTENIAPIEKRDEPKNKAACHSDSFEDDVPDSATSSGYSSSDIASAHDSAEHVGTSASPIGNIARQYYLSVLTEERQKLKGLERLGDIALVHKKLEDLLRDRLPFVPEKERALILEEFFSTWDSCAMNKKKPARDTGQLKRERPRLSTPSIERPKFDDGIGRNLRNALCVYVLRLSNAIRHKTVRWEQLPMDDDSPDDTILYSIVAGRGEIIMVGGIRKDADGG